MISICYNKKWQIDNINGIIFDKDGTLIDSHIYWGRIIQLRANALIKYYSISKDFFEKLCIIMGYSIINKKLLPEGPIALLSREEVIKIVNNYLINVIKINSTIEEITKNFIEVHEKFCDEIYNYIVLLPGVFEFLSKLKQNSVKMAIVTTDSVMNTVETLKHLKINIFFDAVVGKETTIEEKKTGIPALEALKLMNFKNNEVICIGDAPMDLLMAQNSFLKAGIGVITGQVVENELKIYSNYIVENLSYLNIINKG